MRNPPLAGAGRRLRGAVLPGLCAVLAAMLGAAVLAAQTPSNLLHLYYLKGLLGDAGALAQAGELAAPHTSAAPIDCQVALALDSEEQARRACAGLPHDAVRTIIHAVEQLGKTQGAGKALQLFQLLSSLHPDSAPIYYHLSQYQPPGRPETVDSLRRALELSGGSAGVSAAGSPSLTTWELVDAHLRLAQNYLWWEAYAPARDEAAAALRLIPSARAYRLQALAYAHLGEFDGANLSMQAAAAMDASYWLYLDRGDVNAMQGSLDAAAADYRQFIALAGNADAPQGYLRLCKLYVEGSDPAAVEPCRTLVGYNETDASYRLLLGDAYASAGQPAAALEQYRRGLAVDPQNADLLDRLQKAGRLP